MFFFGGKVCFLPFLTVPDGDLDDLGWLRTGKPPDCHCHTCSRSHLSLWLTSEPGTEDSFLVWTYNSLGITARGPGGRQENKEADVGHLYGPGCICV